MKLDTWHRYKHLLCIIALFLTLMLFFPACQVGQAQTVTIGVINVAPILDSVLDGFKEGMTELEYIEGENIIYLYEGSVGRDELDRAARELLEQDVDLILALSTPATLAVQTAVTDDNPIPVLFVPVTDPVKAGIVQSLSEPGANMTGITTGAAEARRLEWLVQINPHSQRIYLPYNPDDSSPAAALPTWQETAAKLNIELVLHEVRTEEDVKMAIGNIPPDVDAIYIGPDSLVGSFFTEWVDAAYEHKLPVSGSSVAHVEAGMLFSYSYDTFTAGKQAARLAEQILSGVHPSDLPVETAEFFLTINLKTAEAIELEIPNEVLNLTTSVIR